MNPCIIIEGVFLGVKGGGKLGEDTSMCFMSSSSFFFVLKWLLVHLVRADRVTSRKKKGTPGTSVAIKVKLVLMLLLTGGYFSRFGSDVPHGLHDAHHPRVLQSEREHILPHPVIERRVPIE
jgi:hypothetical protein